VDDNNGVQFNESIRPDDQLKLTEEVPNYSQFNYLVVYYKYFHIISQCMSISPNNF